MISRGNVMRAAVAVLVLASVWLGRTGPLIGQTGPEHRVAAKTSPATSALNTAARNGKYLFVFFWKENDRQTQTMYGVFKSAAPKIAESATAISVNTNDAREKPIVDRFGVSRAPMPLVLALAPNGAVTKGFPVRFTEEQLLHDAFVSPGTAKCLKALQDRKLVLLCVQNQGTQFSQAAMQGVMGFKSKAQLGSATEIVMVDPSDANEASFLQSLEVDPRTANAVTVLLAPPGRPVAKFVGPVNTDDIVAKVTASQSACGPGGCCPGGQCGPQK
ncbi:MAG: hypothetical protein ISR77_15125 [Pirellulaceae bacterium]|nr:hypothetical protein [Pirellulaceae bacterium]